MPLEEQIVEWSTSRPAWQRAILRRVATGEVLSAKDYEKLVDDLLSSHKIEEVGFGLEQLPQSQAGDPPVRLISVEHPEHVNALTSDKPLTFEEKGLTIIYGDNGSGKSGYARLLKRVARSRCQEEILTDVFLDNVRAKPTASLTIRVGDKDISLKWPESTQPELQRMLFFDGACGHAYVNTESDFPYGPSAIFVMDGLIDACVALRSLIDVKLEENSQRANTLPIVDEQIRETDIGKHITHLSATSSSEALNALIEKAENHPRTIANLKEEESRLLVADTSKERQRLIRQAGKMDSLRVHVEGLQRKLGDAEIEILERERDNLQSLSQASIVQAKMFAIEPLSGVGTPVWKQLWESARRFSEQYAYPNIAYPATDPPSRCVLCQQTLEADGDRRLLRFDRFVKDDIQKRLREAGSMWELRVADVNRLQARPDVIETNLNDLESDYADLVQKVRTFLDSCETAHTSTVKALSTSAPLTRFGLKVSESAGRLDAEATEARSTAEGLKDAVAIKARLASITIERKELEMLQTVKIKAQDVTERLGDLRDELARIKKESATWDEVKYEAEVATWAGELSETWERIVSQEVVGQILPEGGLEVRPMKLKLLVPFSATDEREYQGSYGRVSLWVKRHDKSTMVQLRCT